MTEITQADRDMAANYFRNPSLMTDAEKQLRSMESSEQVATFVVGAFHRRQFRRSLMIHRLKFTEDKGFLDSLFVVHGTYRQLASMHEVGRRLMA